jgi:hypothetical protein
MALSSAEIYRLTAEQLREDCSKQGLDSIGPVRVLRQRLVRQLKVEIKASKQDDQNVNASVTTDLSSDTIQMGTLNTKGASDAGVSGGSNSVFVELMRKVSPLTSEEPEAILRFIVRLDEIHVRVMS